MQPCKLGCALESGDAVEHYLCCPALDGLALRHLRLELPAIREGGASAVLLRVGIRGDRGFRLALHVDAALMTYTRVRQDCAGGGEGLRRPTQIVCQLRSGGGALVVGVPALQSNTSGVGRRSQRCAN